MQRVNNLLKVLALSCVAVLFSLTAQAQTFSFGNNNGNYGGNDNDLYTFNDNYSTNADVGIRLKVKTTSGTTKWSDWQWWHDYNTERMYFSYWESTSNARSGNRTGIGNIRMTLTSDGKLGIGTTNPTYKLHVAGSAQVNSNLTTNGHLTINGNAYAKTNLVVGGNTTPQEALHVLGRGFFGKNQWGAAIILQENVGSDNWVVGLNSADDFRIATVNNTEYLVIKENNGNMGLGVGNPSAKLHVAGSILSSSTIKGSTLEGTTITGTTITNTGNIATATLSATGTITADRVSVTAGTFPDYVFAPSYALMPLQEVEAYINAHQHLPKFPSANEVIANGQDLGQLNILLTEKVEELTLYTIAQEKAIEALQAELAAIKAMVND